MTAKTALAAHGARPGHLRLPPGAPLARGLAAAFLDIITHARQRAAEAAADPVTAVHEYRKALRRARAMMRLLQGIVDDDAHRRLARALRDAHRATSHLRDRHVVLHTLDSLTLDQDLAPLADTLRRTLHSAAPADPAQVRATLSQGEAALEPLPARLARALPAQISWKALRRGLRRSYARAQLRMHDAFQHGSEDAIHDWRKRTKELHHHLELLASMVPTGKLRALRRSLAGVSRELGRVMDLMVLRHHAHEHGQPDELAPLIARIQAEEAQAFELVLESGPALFERAPGRFSRRVTRSTRRAHKLARRSRRRGS